MVVLATFSHIHLRPQPQVPSAARALLTGQPQRPEGAAPRLLVSRCPDPATLLLDGLVAVPVSRTHGKKSDVCAEAWPPPSQQEVLGVGGGAGTWAQRVRPCLSGASSRCACPGPRGFPPASPPWRGSDAGDEGAADAPPPPLAGPSVQATAWPLPPLLSESAPSAAGRTAAAGGAAPSTLATLGALGASVVQSQGPSSPLSSRICRRGSPNKQTVRKPAQAFHLRGRVFAITRSPRNPAYWADVADDLLSTTAVTPRTHVRPAARREPQERRHVSYCWCPQNRGTDVAGVTWS